MSQSKRRGLGRGLDALLTTPASNSSEEPGVDKGNKESELQNLPIEQLHPGKYQTMPFRPTKCLTLSYHQRNDMG